LGYVVKNNEKLLKMSNELVQSFKNSQLKQTFMEKSRSNIVDIAGRQRMLTQKMTKEKLLILAKVAVEKNREKLQKTISLFDTSLKGLMNGNKELTIIKPSNKKIVKQLQIVKAIWRDLKPLYEKKSLKNKELTKVIKENPILLAQMHKAVVLSVDVADY
jgi:methyl-accepting chemotaxis protein